MTAQAAAVFATKLQALNGFGICKIGTHPRLWVLLNIPESYVNVGRGFLLRGLWRSMGTKAPRTGRRATTGHHKCPRAHHALGPGSSQLDRRAQISNRHAGRLEFAVTHRKQTTEPNSNRHYFGLFTPRISHPVRPSSIPNKCAEGICMPASQVLKFSGYS